MWYKTRNLFSIKDFFSKCDQVRSSLQTWSHSLKKSFMEDFIFWCSAYGSLSAACNVSSNTFINIFIDESEYCEICVCP